MHSTRGFEPLCDLIESARSGRVCELRFGRAVIRHDGTPLFGARAGGRFQWRGIACETPARPLALFGRRFGRCAAFVPRRRRAAWYKSGVIYEVHVRAFYDSNADGTGDFRGLTEKLDYIKDLGVTAIWLLPFYPSPLKDDGYDIADYCAVHPSYGTLADFKKFLRQAHRLGLRVITELVLNHTSDQHPWFQRARRAKPGSRWRDFYVWSSTASEYHDARVIFK
jgi:hypothetical protein